MLQLRHPPTRPLALARYRFLQKRLSLAFSAFFTHFPFTANSVMYPLTHQAIAATHLGNLERIEVPKPTPGPGEILLHVKYAALSPADTYQVDHAFLLGENPWPHIPGLSGAGHIKEVGEDIDDLKVGDAVSAIAVCFSVFLLTPFLGDCIYFRTVNSQATAGILYCPADTRDKGPISDCQTSLLTLLSPFNVKVSESYPLLDAASIPDNYVTAMYAVFGSENLALPLPPHNIFPASAPPVNQNQPILVYGAGSSSGQYTVQVLALAGYTNIIATASPRHHALLKSSGAGACIDYHAENLATQILQAGGGKAMAIVIDCIGARASIEAYAPAVDTSTRVSFLMPVKDGDNVVNGPDSGMHIEIPSWASQILPGAQLIPVYTFQHQKVSRASYIRYTLSETPYQDPIAREYFMPKILAQLLKDGLIKPNPVRVWESGPVLDLVKEAFNVLRGNSTNGEKMIITLGF